MCTHSSPRPPSLRAPATRWLAIAILTFLGACARCGGGPEAPGVALAPPEELTPLDVEPLPMPPQVKVAPGTIAGIPAGPVAVVVARPQGEVRGTQRPAVTFNKPLVALGDIEATAPPPLTIDPPVSGTWRWIGSASVEFAPTSDLPWATEFTVTIPAGLKAVDGSTLPAASSFKFSTLRPAWESSDPQDGWPWLPPDGALQLTFNMPVKDLASHLQITADGVPVPFSVRPGVDIEAEQAKSQGRRPPSPRRSRGVRTWYAVAAQATLSPGAQVRVTLLDGLRAAEGTLTATPREARFQVTGPMRFLSARACDAWRESCPHGPVLLSSTNEVDAESLKGRVRFEPPVVVDEDSFHAFAAAQEGAWSEIHGSFRAGTTYRVVVDAGVTDTLGQRAPAFTAQVRLSDREPDLLVPADIVLIEAGGDDSYPVEAVNVPEVRVVAEPLTPAQLAPLVTGRADQPVLGARSVPMVVDTSSTRNVGVRQPLRLTEVFDPGAPRLFRLTLDAPGAQGKVVSKRSVLGQITDLATHAKLGATSSVVWVTSLSRGAPVPDARVSLLDGQGKTVAEAMTDVDGIARLPGLHGLVPSERDLPWRVPDALVVAEKDGDVGVAASSWSGEIGPSAGDVPFSWDASLTEVGMVVTERGIYRPGDEVHIKGILRLRRQGRMLLPEPGSRLEVQVSRDGDSVAKENVAVTRFGTFSTSVRIPADARLGWYSVDVEARVDGERVALAVPFRMEEYRAPRFKVDVTSPTAHLIAGDVLKARAEARYLFGAAMPGANVEATALRSTVDFAPAGLERYAFGIQSWGYDDGPVSSYEDVVARQLTILGEDGGVDLALGAVNAPARRTAEYVVEAEVVDVSRQRVANRARVMVHPASVYVGVRTGEGFGEVGKPLTVELIAAHVDGTRAAGVPLAVAVKRREWRSVRKKDPYSGRYQTLSEPEDVEVSRCARSSAADAPVRCEVLPDKAGLYLVEATATDPQGRTQTTITSIYVAGGGWVSWQRTDGELLELVADRASYEPGQTAKVLVKSPWPEAEALITLEREGVIMSRRQRLAGAATTIELPIDDDAVPNVFASVLLVRGRAAGAQGPSKEVDPGRPQVRAGYLRLAVERKSKRLNVDIDTGGSIHRPGEKVKVKLAVRDAEGAGRAAEVALWAVDEAVLRLTDYALRDPVEAMHPPRDLSVGLGEATVFLLRRQGYGEKGRPPGGDGGSGSGSGFRSNFKTTAFFLPAVTTNARGAAEVEVTLPDDLTTYRVLALAVTDGDLAGTGRADIVVQKPLLVLPALPRLARVGDRFEAGVVVNSRTDADVLVTTDVTGLKLDGDARQHVRVMAGRSLEVRFAFVAEAAGRARLRFRAVAGDEADGVETLLPVVLSADTETVAAAGETDERQQEALAPPAGVLPDVGGLELRLASTALAGFHGAMEQLVEYPYGCAEQLSSRLVPFLALRELQGLFGLQHGGGTKDARRAAQWLGFPPDAVAPPDEVAHETVRALAALQAPDGGFRFWTTSPCAAPDVSSWATLALHRAKELGYPVEEQALKQARRFLLEHVAADKLPACGTGVRRAEPEERIFALWVLARLGAPANSFLEGLYQSRAGLALDARAMLTDAYVLGGSEAATHARTRTLLQEVMNAARESARGVHFADDALGRWGSAWSSDVRTTAIVLMLLTDAQTEHPFVDKAARWLQGARSGGRYRTTQEAAFALMAITELVRAREREAPDFEATVALGPEALVRERFQGRSLDIVTTTIPLRALGTAPAPLVFEKSGAGRLSYTATLTYAKAEMPSTPLDAGMAVQRWFEPLALAPGSGQVRRVRAGELVRIKVRVATSSERRFVAVDVPLPAGLEIVDASLASAGRAALIAEDGADAFVGADGDQGVGDDDAWAGAPWTPFQHVERRDDRAVFFADVLPPGVHTASVVARATTIGTFVLKPATAEEMYAPEVFGRSDGGRFVVLAP